ncbi:MAG: rhodanese-like domain-containing protein [Chloroflexi bacterium]|nr:rhodanese-like domain-containing protein [Chloroflexota bacterium]
MKNKYLGLAMAALVAVSVTLAGCSRGGAAQSGTKLIEVEGGRFTDVMPAELNSMMKDKRFLLVNVHVPYQGELPGTDLFIPYDTMEQNISSLPEDKGARIVLYCVSGHMSALAAKTLVRLGYRDVWNLHGGMAMWASDGLPAINVSR